MTIETLIGRLMQANFGLSQAGARDMLAQVEEAMADELVDGEEVRLSGFGSLYVTERAASKGRNPRTGAEIDVAAKRSVKFRTSKALSDRLNAPQPAARKRELPAFGLA